MNVQIKRIKRLCDNLCNKLEKKIFITLFQKHRRNRLKYDDFTIISNNCWGGCCYEYSGMQKLSPTIGAYFFADDYVKFCSNLKYYFSQQLKIVSVSDSSHYEAIKRQNNTKAIIGRLDDVEIVFLH